MTAEIQQRASSALFPAVPVAVSIRRESGCIFGNKIDIFARRFFFGFAQRFFVVLLGNEHVKRWHDEQRENGSDGHATDEDKTDRISRGRAGAGVDPTRTIAVSLDVGTDNETLLNDPFYLGNRHARHRGADYDAFIQSYIETAHELFPNAMLHFEDFGPEHARDILATYSPDYCVFNDDVQGTGAVVMAAVYSGLKVARSRMADQKLVVFGSGTAGVGIADQLRDAMIADGATEKQATAQVWLVDKQGLLFDDMDDLRICTRLAVMVRGRVVREVTERPWNRVELIAAMEGLDAAEPAGRRDG